METELMSLKILLPFKVFLEVQSIKRIVAETGNGQYGFWPHRLDCVAELVAGIFMYESTTGGEKYIAVDKGILVKAGTEVMVSVRNAIGGADLGKLHELVEKKFKEQNESEKNMHAVMKKMESSFMLQLQKFQELQK